MCIYPTPLHELDEIQGQLLSEDKSKVGDLSQVQPKGSIFISYNTKV